MPQLQELAAIDVEQIANVDSADLLFAHWRALVGRIRAAFAADPELAGVVITHGTNTLEETAWLLQLLIDDPRPVVLVGAMRPATALSADGPLNLLQAVQVALSPEARGPRRAGGDGWPDPCRPAGHQAGHPGGGGVRQSRSRALGLGGRRWRSSAHGEWTRQVPFAGLDLPEQWPQVPIVYGCVEPEPLLLSACLNAGVEGLVFTGTGAGQLSAAERSALEAWPGKRPLMLRANRCGSGPVHHHSEDERLGLLPAGSLNPQKARVLLLLAVLAGWDRDQLQALITASP